MSDNEADLLRQAVEECADRAWVFEIQRGRDGGRWRCAAEPVSLSGGGFSREGWVLGDVLSSLLADLEGVRT